MTAVRRIYVYVVSFAALSTLALGVANLVRALLEAWVSTVSATSPGYLQDQVALWGAAGLVGLPVWALHWRWAERLSAEPSERASALRRLFLYGVLLGSAYVALVSVDEMLAGLFRGLVGAPVALATEVVPPLPLVLGATLVWAYHWHVAARDRAAVGEIGASATLRRWYLYGTAFFGWLLLLTGAQMLVMSVWLSAVSPQLGYGGQTSSARMALVALALWAVHWVWLPRALGEPARTQDRASTLGSVYLFLGLAIVLLGTLSGISQALYYALGRLLGVAEPGGVGGSLLVAAAGPGSVMVVFGVGWVYQRSVIRGLARELEFEAPRQIGVRRLYEHLTALVALSVLAVGLAGLLWVLGDAISQARDSVGQTWWRDRISLFTTLTSVGLPVWLLHWRAPTETTPRSLIRRVYLYVTLIAAVLALLGSGAAATYRLLGVVLGAANASTAAIDLSHALAVALVAAGLAAYHWRMVRLDLRTQAAAAAPLTPVEAIVELRAPSARALASALEAVRSAGVTVQRLNAPSSR